MAITNSLTQYYQPISTPLVLPYILLIILSVETDCKINKIQLMHLFQSYCITPVMYHVKVESILHLEYRIFPNDHL